MARKKLSGGKRKGVSADSGRAAEASDYGGDLFRALTGITSAAICILQDGRFRFVNPAMERISGYNREELLSADFVDLVHPDSKEQVTGAYHDWAKGNRDEFRFEFKGMSRHGGAGWVDVVAKSIDYEGRPALLLTGVDITGHKRVEEALRASEEKFRLVADFTSDWESWIDMNGNYLYISPSCERITGYCTEEFYGNPNFLINIVVPEDRPAYLNHKLTHVNKRNGEGAIDFRITTRPGEVRWISHLCQPVFGKDGEWLGRRASNRDITERKRAEEAINRSEKMLQLVMDNIPQAVFWKDRNSTYLGCNKVFAIAAGVGTPENIRGKTDYDLPWSREQADFFRGYDRKIMENDTPEYHIFEQQREAIGRTAWVETNKVPLHDVKGIVTGILGTYVDITGRKRAEDALRESEEKFRVLAETSTAMFWLYQGERFVYVNGAGERLTGYPIDELLKMRFWDVVHPDDRDLVRGRGLARQQGLPVPGKYEVKLLTRGGETRWVELTAGRIEYRGKPAGIATFFDITDRKKAEMALRDSEQTKMVLMDGISECMFLMDRNGIILDANSVLAKRLGKSREELIGACAYDFIDPGTAWSRKRKIDEVFGSGLPASFEDSREGTCFENIVTPVFSEDGKVEKVAIIAIDITGRKQTEAALRDAKSQAELYLDLMGHDINNMHQIALGYMELARDEQTDDRLKEYLDRPIEVLQRSARLIKNVRKLQKLRDGAFGTGLVDVGEVLSDVHREFGAVPRRVVTLNLNGAGRCEVRANELLYDVFANLVSNAIKHTGDRTEIVVDLSVAEDQGSRHCRVTVEDNGPGIPDDFKDKIFHRMLRGTDKAKGMGLGLYLVKSLVDSYGGRVWVEDRVPGDHTKGAKFVVLLPAVEKSS